MLTHVESISYFEMSEVEFRLRASDIACVDVFTEGMAPNSAGQDSRDGPDKWSISMSWRVPYDALIIAATSLLQLVVMAMLVERSVAFLFECPWVARANAYVRGIKALAALGVAVIMCVAYRFDILAKLLYPAGGPIAVTRFGIALTSTAIAGASAGVMAILQGRLDWSKPSRDNLIRAKQLTAAALAREAEARQTAARALLVEAESRLIRAQADLAQASDTDRLRR